MLLLVRSGFSTTLYFVFFSVIVKFVSISLISVIVIWPYFLIVLCVRNGLLIIMITLSWNFSQCSSCLFMCLHDSMIMLLNIDIYTLICKTLTFKIPCGNTMEIFLVNIHLQCLRFLGCYTVSSGQQFLIFQGIAVPSKCWDSWPSDTV